jgi:NADH:ubiquinone oxidoreductase subunit F (NADH-binding)/NADH:ubiquinone oxidoreductase subunit E/Pyruvate/2-oxoacid:ferredoxin oxidoreductase delta subunit
LKYLCENSGIAPSEAIGVSTFYSQFRFKPAGRYDINICVGTACHIKGAELVYDAFRRRLGCTADGDTDSQMQFTVNKVACLGCCSLAPAVQVGGVIYGHVTAAGVGDVIKDFLGRSKKVVYNKNISGDKNQSCTNEVRVCRGSCCSASGTADIESAVCKAIARYNLPVKLKRVGCVGMCHRTPLIEVIADGKSQFYAQVNADDVPGIILRHFSPLSIVGKAVAKIDTAAESIFLSERSELAAGRLRIGISEEAVDNFFNKQKRIATEHYGTMTPLDIDEYINRGGFSALKNCLDEQSPENIINIIKDSGLRGRGGAGFPTGLKWGAVRKNALSNGNGSDINTQKGNDEGQSPRDVNDVDEGQLSNNPQQTYLICNGDEGDPGAFMDRMLLESFPYRIIEGMLIAAYAVGANEGIFYIRAEYPVAISTIREAIDACKKKNIIGSNIFNSNFSIILSIVEGAGAFVCGEETALIKSIEGKRGMPAPKPPFPAESGLWGNPTLINNCETFACVPWIIHNGSAQFRAIGTNKSPGTKVFALAGKIARGGLIETPMGCTIKDIVEHIGGGTAGDRTFKAVQIGGPSGGCIPARLGDTTVDFEKLAEAGAMMGSGGFVVLDERDCMVDIAKYFLAFTQNQSCGRCTFCRIGTDRMLDILEKICAGKGTRRDLEILEELAVSVKKASLCGLGKTAPNPVLTTLKYFRDEYEAHINGECPAGKCKDLISYRIIEDCNGCTICSQNCPVNAIRFTPYNRHSVDDDLCTRCGVCLAACPMNAIEIVQREKERAAASPIPTNSL